MSNTKIPAGPYLYALIDDEGEVFYVGKGRGRRMYQHKHNAISGKPGAKCDYIRDVIARGGDIECVVVSVFNTDEEACAAEVQMIASLSGLKNMTKGGEIGGAANYKEVMRRRAIRLKERLLRDGLPVTDWVMQEIDKEIADPSPNVATWTPGKGVVFGWESDADTRMTRKEFQQLLEDKISG